MKSPEKLSSSPAEVDHLLNMNKLSTSMSSFKLSPLVEIKKLQDSNLIRSFTGQTEYSHQLNSTKC